jgi:hypothetical protein
VLGLVAGCATTQAPPSCAAVCLTTSCDKPEQMPLFWSGDAPPYAVVDLAELQVDASELAGPGYGPPSRDEMLQALARKAKGLGADALTHVQVEEVLPVHQPVGASSMTQLVPAAQGDARGMAVRRVEPPPDAG